VIEGTPVEFKTTKAALNAGIAVIYQELNLVPEMTVAENLFLGHMPKYKSRVIDFKAMYQRASEELKFIMEDIDPRKLIKNLPIAQRQMIEIAKALLKNAKIIAFDEPTSSLSEMETRHLFQIIRDLKRQGKCIIYVSHRLEEIFEVCNSVTVFRDGKCIETFRSIENVTQDLLVSRMVGRDIKNIFGYRKRDIGKIVLEVQDLAGKGVREPTSFSVRQGEIVGFFGLVGAGRSELMKLIFGANVKKNGTVSMKGDRIEIGKPGDAIRHGIAYLPEDRKDEGIIPIQSVEDNINLSSRRNHRRYGFFLNKRWETTNAKRYVETLSIKTPSIRQSVGNLSGGNQQKVVLARWLSENVNLIIMDEPTRGIDVGTKSEIYNLMYDLTDSGKAILCVSSDLPEIMGITDRLIIMKDGRIVATMDRSEMEKEQILRLALPDRNERSDAPPATPETATHSKG
jgi:L-arabinose transport system ATP-binding protein